MRINREFVALFILLMAFIAGGFFLGGRSHPSTRMVGADNPTDPSVDNDRTTGSKGIFQWVNALGYRAVAYKRPWSALGNSGAHFLFAIDPQAASIDSTLTGAGDSNDDSALLTDIDAKLLLNWIRKGNIAFIASSDLSDSNSRPDPFASALGISVNPLSDDTDEDASITQDEFSPTWPAQDTQGVTSIHTNAPARVTESLPAGVSLFGDKLGTIVLTRAYGKGRIYVISDGLFLSNGNFGLSENAQFIANLLSRNADRHALVLFDEYHYGDGSFDTNSGVWQALGAPLQLVLIQLALAGLVLVAFLWVRVGPAVPLMRGVRRNSGEYVTSLAGLYQRAGASLIAMDIVYRTFIRDMTAHLALAPDVDSAQLLAAATRRGHTDKDNFRTILSLYSTSVAAGSIKEADLLDLMRRMERVRKDLGVA